METRTGRVKVQKTARYYLAGGNDRVSELWIVLHGYSQLAADFISRFDVLASPGCLVAAPEGLSRFYTKGYFGKIGASWMTREDRHLDIIDNLQYLDRVTSDLIAALPAPPERVVVLGFSQGAATAARWAAVTSHNIGHLVIWCSDFPRDITDESLQALSRKTQTWYVHSTHDEFMDEALFAQQIQYLEEKNVGHRQLVFEGRHELKDTVLLQLAASIRSLHAR